MTHYRIRLTLEPDPGGVFTVTSPDVPGLVTEGKTADEIQANVQEALNALLEAWSALGKNPPSALRPLRTDREEVVEVLVTAA